ncbi:MAG: hypothetical protein JXQ87_00060 [Bacteroidia bacterium]
MKFLVPFLFIAFIINSCTNYEERRFPVKRLSKVLHANGDYEEYAFNANGQVISKLEKSGEYEYPESYSYLENGLIDEVFEHWHENTADSGGVWKYHYNQKDELIKRTFHYYNIHKGLSAYGLFDTVIKVKGSKVFELATYNRYYHDLIWYLGSEYYTFTLDCNVKSAKHETANPSGNSIYEVEYEYDRKPYFALYNPAYDNFINTNKNNIIGNARFGRNESSSIEYEYDEDGYPVLLKEDGQIFKEFFYD